jgi:ABC-type transporter Mla subunit MlaD
METRASYIAVGSFVLVLILCLVGFVIWIGKFRGRRSLPATTSCSAAR